MCEEPALEYGHPILSIRVGLFTSTNNITLLSARHSSSTLIKVQILRDVKVILKLKLHPQAMRQSIKKLVKPHFPAP